MSPETVRAVRAGLRASARASRPTALTERAALLQWLRNDRALRSSERGRALLRVLRQQLEVHASWAGLIRDVPPHCHDGLAAFARQNALEWHAPAQSLERDVAP